MKFSERLKKACDRAGIEWSQTAIGRALGVSKQTAERWMGDGKPASDTLFEVADKLRARGVPIPLSDPRWLATGGEETKPPAAENDDILPLERELVANYRLADPRWQLSLRLLAALANEDQLEVAGDVNVIIAQVMGKKPADVRYASNQRVAAAFGEAPHVSARKQRSEK